MLMGVERFPWTGIDGSQVLTSTLMYGSQVLTPGLMLMGVRCLPLN